MVIDDVEVLLVKVASIGNEFFVTVGEGLLAREQVGMVQTSHLIAQDTGHLVLPSSTSASDRVPGKSAAGLIANFVVHIVISAGLLNDLARIRTLSAYQFRIS